MNGSNDSSLLFLWTINTLEMIFSFVLHFVYVSPESVILSLDFFANITFLVLFVCILGSFVLLGPDWCWDTCSTTSNPRTATNTWLFGAVNAMEVQQMCKAYNISVWHEGFTPPEEPVADMKSASSWLNQIEDMCVTQHDQLTCIGRWITLKTLKKETAFRKFVQNSSLLWIFFLLCSIPGFHGKVGESGVKG